MSITIDLLDISFIFPQKYGENTEEFIQDFMNETNFSYALFASEFLIPNKEVVVVLRDKKICVKVDKDRYSLKELICIHFNTIRKDEDLIDGFTYSGKFTIQYEKDICKHSGKNICKLEVLLPFSR